MENRVIKFRCWNTELEKFFYSEYNDEVNDGREYYPFCFWVGFKGDHHPKMILQQFTGLHDKSGKEIYENDVIEFTLEDGTKERGTVRFAAGGFWTTQAEGHSEELLSDELDYESLEATIVGHIYQQQNGK